MNERMLGRGVFFLTKVLYLASQISSPKSAHGHKNWSKKQKGEADEVPRIYFRGYAPAAERRDEKNRRDELRKLLQSRRQLD